jgi:hypothetical protein
VIEFGFLAAHKKTPSQGFFYGQPTKMACCFEFNVFKFFGFIVT